MISVDFQGKPFNIKIIQVYSPTSNAEEAELEWLNLTQMTVISTTLGMNPLEEME